MEKFKKPLIVIGIVAAALVVGTVIMGILNALVADGSWHFGWESYRYDESGYEVGGASVPSVTVSRIDLDWLDGSVTVLPCDDKYISISEVGQGSIAEDNRLRWSLSEDGSTLSIKYRKSAWFLSASLDRSKTLVLRIPRTMLEGLEELSIRTVRGTVTLQGVSAEQVRINSERGDVRLAFTQDASFTLFWEGREGSMISDLPLEQKENGYCYGAGKDQFLLASKYGELTVLTEE